jgi:hypothetical protein
MNKTKLTKQEVESLKHSKKGYLLRPTAKFQQIK